MGRSRREPGEVVRQKTAAVRADRAAAELRYQPGTKVAIRLANGDTRHGVVVSSHGSIYGEVVTAELHGGGMWSGTAERVRRV